MKIKLCAQVFYTVTALSLFQTCLCSSCSKLILAVVVYKEENCITKKLRHEDNPRLRPFLQLEQYFPNECPQSMFLRQTKKNNVYPFIPHFPFTKLGFPDCSLHGLVNVMPILNYIFHRTISAASVL